MENSATVSYFENTCDKLLQLLKIKKINGKIFDDETNSLFEFTVSQVQENLNCVEKLNVLLAEQKHLEEMLAQQNIFKEKGLLMEINATNTNVRMDPPGPVSKNDLTLQESLESPVKQSKIRGKTSEETFIVANCRQNLALTICLKMKPITETEFSSIPSYMKGRLKLSQINELVEKFNEILTNKYELLENGMKKCTTREMKDKYIRYKSQELDETKNQRFCVDEDLRDNFSTKEIQHFQKHIIQVFRHCKRLRELRSRNTDRLLLNRQ